MEAVSEYMDEDVFDELVKQLFFSNLGINFNQQCLHREQPFEGKPGWIYGYRLRRTVNLFDDEKKKSDDLHQEADSGKDQSDRVVVMKTLTTLAEVSERGGEKIVGSQKVADPHLSVKEKRAMKKHERQMKAKSKGIQRISDRKRNVSTDEAKVVVPG